MLTLALGEKLTGEDASTSQIDRTGFSKEDRLVGKRIDQFRFKLHIREPNEEELFTSAPIDAKLRLDLAPENVGLLKFFVNKCKGDPEYMFTLKWEQESENCGMWHAKLGRSELNTLDHEYFTNTDMMIRLPADWNNSLEGVGTLGLRVVLRTGFVDIFMLLGTAKEQLVRKGDTIIGYVENYKDVQDFFSMVDTPEKRKRFGRSQLGVEAEPTLEFLDD